MVLAAERVRTVWDCQRGPARRAPARRQGCGPVWLLGLVVIGRLNALGYAERIDKRELSAHRR